MVRDNTSPPFLWKRNLDLSHFWTVCGATPLRGKTGNADSAVPLFYQKNLTRHLSKSFQACGVVEMGRLLICDLVTSLLVTELPAKLPSPELLFFAQRHFHLQVRVARWIERQTIGRRRKRNLQVDSALVKLVEHGPWALAMDPASKSNLHSFLANS